MGVFVNLIKSNEAYIPADKTEEFIKRIEKLFQASGMMDWDRICITDEMEIMDEDEVPWYYTGKRIILIKKAEMDADGMDFTYNYFEDTHWENAGFSVRGRCVTSNKTGGHEFCRGVLAAYFLEQQYTEGASFVECAGDFQEGYLYTGWINYLFEEKYIQKNRNAWKLYEIAHYSDNDYNECIIDREARFISKYDEDILGYIEMRAITEKTPEVETIKDYKEKYQKEGSCIGSDFEAFFATLENMLSELREHKDINVGESDIDEIFGLMKDFYGSDISIEAFMKMCNEKGLENFGIFTSKYDFPAFAVKALAENYDKDFWELWDCVRKDLNNSKRKFSGIIDPAEPEKPISTQEIFKISDDDMIPYWTGNGDIEFSVELISWFIELRARYNAIYETIKVDRRKNYKKWIIEIMCYASWEYFRIYVFADFFYDTMDNLYDRRYIALWKLYEELLHDPELEKAGSVIFKSEDNKQEDETSHIFSAYKETRRPINFCYWDLLSKEERFNKARKTFRRYMALVANKELRNKVFGF